MVCTTTDLLNSFEIYTSFHLVERCNKVGSAKDGLQLRVLSPSHLSEDLAQVHNTGPSFPQRKNILVNDAFSA